MPLGLWRTIRLIQALIQALALGALPLLSSDLTLTCKISGKDLRGRKVDGLLKQYFSVTKSRENNVATGIDKLKDYGTGTFYEINHREKKIYKSTLEGRRELAQAVDKQLGPLVKSTALLAFGDPAQSKLEELGSEKILGKTCRKVRLTVGKWIEELSLDPTLNVPLDPSKVIDAMVPNHVTAVIDRLGLEKIKLKGVALRTHSRGVLDMDQRIEVTAIDTHPIPPSLWQLPKGYTWVDRSKEAQKALLQKTES